MFNHDDILKELNCNLPLAEKLQHVHEVLRARFPFIARVAVATYHSKTDELRTFVHSSGDDKPLSHYQAKLAEATTLREILERKQPRVVEDLGIFSHSTSEHTVKLLQQGYQSSYTMPMYIDGLFFGFIFFNSYQKAPFDEESLHYLDLFGHLISLMIINHLNSVRTLVGVLKTARDMTHRRDTETGAHLDRMSHYAHLIAQQLADKYELDDDFVEHILLFASLHDIGKIVLPDSILLKEGKLTDAEFNLMKTHTIKGREIIDMMLSNLNLTDFQHMDVLRNIAEFHHEALNGSGYPHGLKGDQIPIEARIAAVADIFDALTSRRPYKEAWSNQQALAYLCQLAGSRLDQDCVEALERNQERIEMIQARFREDKFG